MKEKVCSSCLKQKDKSEFYSDKTKKDGLKNICKTCTKKRSQEYYEENKEQVISRVNSRKSYKQKYKEENKDRISLYNKTHYANREEPIVDDDLAYMEKMIEQLEHGQ